MVGDSLSHEADMYTLTLTICFALLCLGCFCGCIYEVIRRKRRATKVEPESESESECFIFQLLNLFCFVLFKNSISRLRSSSGQFTKNLTECFFFVFLDICDVKHNLEREISGFMEKLQNDIEKLRTKHKKQIIALVKLKRKNKKKKDENIEEGEYVCANASRS